MKTKIIGLVALGGLATNLVAQQMPPIDPAGSVSNSSAGGDIHQNTPTAGTNTNVPSQNDFGNTNMAGGGTNGIPNIPISTNSETGSTHFLTPGLTTNASAYGTNSWTDSQTNSVETETNTAPHHWWQFWRW